MKKGLLKFIVLIALIAGCSKKSDTTPPVDYNNGLLTMVAGNKTFRTEKKYWMGTNPPLGYFQLDQTMDQWSNSFYFVTGNFDNLNLCNFYYSLSNNPNDIQKIIDNPQSTYAIINGVRTDATRLVINVVRAQNYMGTYEMYKGTTLYCQGSFSYQ